MTDETLQPVRALLERLGLELMPTLHSTGAMEALATPEDAVTGQPAAWDTPTVPATDEPIPAPRSLPSSIGRHIVKKQLGEGGMGAVYAAHDPEMARDIAVKVMKNTANAHAGRTARFVSEVQITGQLEHPSIIPVHEIGVTPDGELYYTMKRLRGRSLRQVLRDIESGEEEWNLHRLLSVFAQVCDAVAFAHSRGVLHRDLKPDNLMVGRFGEVLVVDWGLAALMGADNPYESEPSGPIDGRVAMHPVRRSTSTWTEDGVTLGSPGYMAPEQASAERAAIGPHTDVFALGCVLYELLTGVRAYHGDNPLQLMYRLMSGPPAPPSEVAPARSIPRELSAIAMQAMAIETGDRPRDAGILGEQVRRWLDGSERRAAARVHLQEAHVRWDSYVAVRDEQAQLTTRERRLAEETPPWTPMAEKTELLALRDRLEALKNERLAAFSGFVTACDQARAKDPFSHEAADLLAEGWWTRLREAEADADAGRVRWCADRVRELAPERYAKRLEGTGSISLITDPPGAQVLRQRVRREGIPWTLEDPVPLGTTPLDRVPLAMGSYILTLRHPDFRDVTYPVLIRRAEHWEGPPVRLLDDAQIGDDWVYVPAGPFLSCGDDGALEARPSARPVLPGFLIRRLPLSLRDYAVFVNGLHQQDPDAAWDCVPSGESGVRESGRRYWDRPQPGADYVIPDVDRDGDPWDKDWPAFGISWHHARACAEWTGRQRGEEVRLPTILQWEKAARGVDGRVWPWGDRFDSTLAKIRTSLPGRPMPVPVGSYATDVSVYGMQDVAGCIRELCDDDTFDGNEMLRPVVGASWNHLPDAARCASRLGTSHWNRSAFMGFRLVRGLPK